MTSPAALPTTGTLTFLFTDIESSTRRWGEHPEAMSLALVRHDELLRAAIEGQGGGVFKHTGDGMSAVFASPYDALSAAVAGQQALQAEFWGDIGDLPVRMGIHIGRAEYRMSDYFGPTLNRVARLMGTAHGKQIVVSFPTQEIVRDDLPPKVNLLDLGEHHLADLARPEHVFQVVHPDLPTSFPPLRCLSVDRHNLPLTLSHFIGRQAELERVGQLLGTERLVTLTGVGGAGKTRLAIRAAADALDLFTDGVFFVTLAALADPDLIPAAVSTALGVGGNTPELLCEYLRTRRLLLVLDNCEHLIAAAADLCELLLGRCCDLSILTTSREPLNVPGEVVWRVPSLSLPSAEGEGEVSGDAVALFCDRARAVDPDFRLGADNAAAVARICRLLDGIPLALELAAARLRMLQPEQVAERLDDRFALLTGSGRNTLPRHHTLRAAMDWSYDLLSAPERTLLGRLSAFAGSFSVEAAESVGADETLAGADVLDLLSHLVDKSLVVVDTGGRNARYRLLATVREYAKEKLAAAGDAEATARRHRDFFLHRLESEGEIHLEEWGCRFWLGSDLENIRRALQWSQGAGDVDAALRLAAALRGHWMFSETPGEGIAVLEQCLAPVDAPSPASVQALTTLAFLHTQQGDIARAELVLQRSLAESQSIGDEVGGARAMGVLGMVALQQGALDRAEQLLEDGIRGTRATRPGYAGWYRFNLSWVAMARGDTAGAARELETVLASDVGRDNEAIAVHALAALAPILALAGEHGRAEDLAVQAVETARKLELRRFLVMTLIRAAEVATLTGSPDLAEASLGEVLPLLRKSAGIAWVADAVEMTALALGARGRHEPAIRLLGACDALRTACGEVGEVRVVHPCRQRYQDEVSSVLEQAQLEDARRHGATLSRDEMVREALTEITRSTT